MAATAPAPMLRKLLEERFSQLSGELETCLDNEAVLRVAAARRNLCEQFNQAVRRLRLAPGLPEMSDVLLDAGVSFCNAAGVFRVTGDAVTGERARGLERGEGFASLRFQAAEAPAFRAVIESGDPVAAMGVGAEISPALASMAGGAADARVYLFPVVAGGRTAAVLAAWGVAQEAWLEALAQVAGAALELREAKAAAPSPELVTVQAAAPPARAELSPAEQQLHLRAQRFARVQVAEMRLFRADEVKVGRARADLYGELKDAIDAARESFRRQFMAASPTMTDYLHLEVLHTLANNDVGLLGEKYPGALV